MMFLTSPALTASRAEWEAWVDQLKEMNTRDESVAFALKRAEQLLAELCESEKAL